MSASPCKYCICKRSKVCLLVFCFTWFVCFALFTPITKHLLNHSDDSRGLLRHLDRTELMWSNQNCHLKSLWRLRLLMTQPNSQSVLEIFQRFVFDASLSLKTCRLIIFSSGIIIIILLMLCCRGGQYDNNISLLWLFVTMCFSEYIMDIVSTEWTRTNWTTTMWA